MMKILFGLFVLALPSVLSAQARKPKPADPKPAAAAAPAKPPVVAPATPATPLSTEATDANSAGAENQNIDAEAAKKHDVSEELIESLKRKRVLNDKDFEKKKTGGFFTGLPLGNYDPNKGIGYGVRVFYFDNGAKESPLFRRTPYRHKLYAQFFQTTNGFQFHEVNWDSPYIGNSLFRIRGALLYEKNTWANYYGTGSRSLNALGTDFSTGTTYSKYSEFNDELRKVDTTTGTTNAAFNRYSYERPAIVATLERDFFGGIVRPQIGLQVSKYNLRDLQGTKVQATGGEGVSNATLLTLLNQQGLVTGYGGGFHNTVRAGLAIDTRDFEPDPNKGQLFEIIAEASSPALGSAYNFARYTVSEKFFFSPFEKFIDLVFATRVAYSQTAGNVPFYVMNQIGSTENTSSAALGGLRSIRGYKDDRFVATNMALANFEIRWTMFDFTVLGQRFAPILVPFFDIGSPFDSPKEFSRSVWRYSYGAGVRIAWNQATIIMFDYAMSKEDSNMFINFNHIF